jgi:hypothetical protein
MPDPTTQPIIPALPAAPSVLTWAVVGGAIVRIATWTWQFLTFRNTAVLALRAEMNGMREEYRAELADLRDRNRYLNDVCDRQQAELDANRQMKHEALGKAQVLVAENGVLKARVKYLEDTFGVRLPEKDAK